ncbi:hypothetical protein KDW99_18635 [Marinomonas rhizomae]|uniref:hypothetical protein n=1 Tax=Marinomonas rhizomae TaxID=491948 RepID=UPI002105326F|nr:hypothetical protein [Marinomonas rhizomae]UTV99238.1 hypothetical protein KDW99_18635 [Marinomonas rhizomae]
MLSVPRVVWIMMCCLAGLWLFLSAATQATSYASLSYTNSSHASHQNIASMSQSSMSDMNLTSASHDHAKNMSYSDCVDHCALAVLPPVLLLLASTVVYWPALSLIEKWRYHSLELVTPPPRLSALIAN